MNVTALHLRRLQCRHGALLNVVRITEEQCRRKPPENVTAARAAAYVLLRNLLKGSVMAKHRPPIYTVTERQTTVKHPGNGEPPTRTTSVRLAREGTPDAISLTFQGDDEGDAYQAGANFALVPVEQRPRSSEPPR